MPERGPAQHGDAEVAAALFEDLVERPPVGTRDAPVELAEDDGGYRLEMSAETQ
jgi:hypothetical protein